MKKQIISFLNQIVGSKVTYSRAGGGAGSIILITFMRENLEYSIMIHCAWRIEDKDKVIATSAGETTAITGVVAKGAKLLEGETVRSIEISPFYDFCHYCPIKKWAKK